jgi:hypothetical protein
VPSLASGRMYTTVRLLGPAGPAYARLRVDTGDDLTLVAPAALAPLGAVPVSFTTVVGIDGRPALIPWYDLDVELVDLAPGQTIRDVRVAAYQVSEEADGLFGDNLLDRGVLVRDGPNRSWTFALAEAGPPQPTSPRAALAVLAGTAGITGAALLAAGLLARA